MLLDHAAVTKGLIDCTPPLAEACAILRLVIASAYRREFEHLRNRPDASLLLRARWIAGRGGPPFCAFPRVTAKLAGKLGDRSLYGPLQEVQLLQPLEPALNVAALDQSFDRLDRPVLPRL